MLMGACSGDFLFAGRSDRKSNWLELDIVSGSCRIPHLCVSSSLHERGSTSLTNYLGAEVQGFILITAMYVT